MFALVLHSARALCMYLLPDLGVLLCVCASVCLQPQGPWGGPPHSADGCGGRGRGGSGGTGRHQAQGKAFLKDSVVSRQNEAERCHAVSVWFKTERCVDQDRAAALMRHVGDAHSLKHPFRNARAAWVCGRGARCYM